jgi:hypothetical protein
MTTRLTEFVELVASSKLLLLLHSLSAFLFLPGAQMLATRLFVSEKSRWGAVVMAGACFTLPVAGTAQAVIDPYVTARASYASNLGDQTTLLRLAPRTIGLPPKTWIRESRRSSFSTPFQISGWSTLR